MPLVDSFGDFCSAKHSCRHCTWSGLGSDMTSGESFGDGIEKHCPQCGIKYSFIQWSVAVADDAEPDWKARIGRVAD